VSHRSYHTGFYFGEAKQIFETSSYVRDYDIVGIVKEYDAEKGIALIEQRNRVFEGEEDEGLRPIGEPLKINLNNMKDVDGNKIEVAPSAQMLFTIETAVALREKDMIIKGKENRQ
jgi:putative protease